MYITRQLFYRKIKYCVIFFDSLGFIEHHFSSVDFYFILRTKFRLICTMCLLVLTFACQLQHICISWNVNCMFEIFQLQKTYKKCISDIFCWNSSTSFHSNNIIQVSNGGLNSQKWLSMNDTTCTQNCLHICVKLYHSSSN